MKSTSRTEKTRYAFDNAPRCGARTKSNHGKPCRCPAIKGKSRCRVHGGANGSGAKIGNTNSLKHGESTAESKAFWRELRQAIRDNKKIIKELSLMYPIENLEIKFQFYSGVGLDFDVVKRPVIGDFLSN